MFHPPLPQQKPPLLSNPALSSPAWQTGLNATARRLPTRSDKRVTHKPHRWAEETRHRSGVCPGSNTLGCLPANRSRERDREGAHLCNCNQKKGELMGRQGTLLNDYWNLTLHLIRSSPELHWYRFSLSFTAKLSVQDLGGRWVRKQLIQHHGWEAAAAVPPGERAKGWARVLGRGEPLGVGLFDEVLLVHADAAAQALQDAAHEERAQRAGERPPARALALGLQGVPAAALHRDHAVQRRGRALHLVQLLHAERLAATEALPVEEVAEGQGEKGARQWEQVGKGTVATLLILYPPILPYNLILPTFPLLFCPR